MAIGAAVGASLGGSILAANAQKKAAKKSRNVQLRQLALAEAQQDVFLPAAEEGFDALRALRDRQEIPFEDALSARLAPIFRASNRNAATTGNIRSGSNFETSTRIAAEQADALAQERFANRLGVATNLVSGGRSGLVGANSLFSGAAGNISQLALATGGANAGLFQNAGGTLSAFFANQAANGSFGGGGGGTSFFGSSVGSPTSVPGFSPKLA